MNYKYKKPCTEKYRACKGIYKLFSLFRFPNSFNFCFDVTEHIIGKAVHFENCFQREQLSRLKNPVVLPCDIWMIFLNQSVYITSSNAPLYSSTTTPTTSNCSRLMFSMVIIILFLSVYTDLSNFVPYRDGIEPL